MRVVLALCSVIGGAAACSSAPDVVEFGTADGVASGISVCDCIYYDSSQGDDPTLQIACSGADAIDDIDLFLDPTRPSMDQGVALLVTPADGTTYKGGGTGQFGSLGPERRARSGHDQIVRDLTGVSIHWDAQEACDVQGCDRTRFSLAAGALQQGGGACEDFWATTDQAL